MPPVAALPTPVPHRQHTHPINVPHTPQMCTKDAAPASCAQPPPAPAPAAVSPPVPDSESDGDDVWADDASDGEGEQGQHQHQQHREGGARATPLDREWAARKQSYHSVGVALCFVCCCGCLTACMNE